MTRTISITFAAVLAALILAGPGEAQVGHPVKGSWLGYWGPSEDEQRRMLLVLDWENREIVGVINPGRGSVTVDRADIDYDTWTLTFEADMPTPDGKSAHLVATGKLENLGSWVNRRFSGTYRLGDETGTFRLTLN